MAFAEDKNELLGILNFTEKLFDELIKQVPQEEQTLFKDAWSEVRPKLQAVTQQIKGLQSEGEDLAIKLAEAGLLGNQLKLKVFKLKRAAKEGWLDKLLRLLNSFLKSLAKAIPGGESIAELKDMFEDSLGGVQTPAPYIQTLFNQGGFVPA